jgi:mono/diheme cytochrome c family protein
MMNPTRALLFCSATFLLTAALSAGAQNQEPAQSSDAHPDFPAGDGRELTMKVCSTCHTLDVVSSERLSPDGWKMTVDQMASMGADATEAQLAQIVGYLAKAFPESTDSKDQK